MPHNDIHILGNSTTLRSAEPQDLDIMYIWESDPDVWQYGDESEIISEQEIYEFIKNQQGLLIDKQLRLMICLPSGEAVGMVDIFEYNPELHSAGVGILIDPAHRGKGYATEAILCAEKHLHKEHNVQQVWCYVQLNNHLSLKLFNRCGYSITETLQDRVLLNKVL